MRAKLKRKDTNKQADKQTNSSDSARRLLVITNERREMNEAVGWGAPAGRHANSPVVRRWKRGARLFVLLIERDGAGRRFRLARHVALLCFPARVAAAAATR